MSKLCLGFLRFPILPEDEERLQGFLHRYGLKLMIYPADMEYLSIDGFDCAEKKPFSISDDGLYDNCEMLLLPDNCVYNGKMNATLFAERMKVIESVFRFLLTKHKEISLFIGECEAYYADYERHDIHIDSFMEVSRRLNSLESISLHVMITN